MAPLRSRFRKVGTYLGAFVLSTVMFGLAARQVTQAAEIEPSPTPSQSATTNVDWASMPAFMHINMEEADYTTVKRTSYEHFEAVKDYSAVDLADPQVRAIVVTYAHNYPLAVMIDAPKVMDLAVRKLLVDTANDPGVMMAALDREAHNKISQNPPDDDRVYSNYISSILVSRHVYSAISKRPDARQIIEKISTLTLDVDAGYQFYFALMSNKTLPFSEDERLAMVGDLIERNEAVLPEIARAFAGDPKKALPPKLAPSLEVFYKLHPGRGLSLSGLLLADKLPEKQRQQLDAIALQVIKENLMQEHWGTRSEKADARQFLCRLNIDHTKPDAVRFSILKDMPTLALLRLLSSSDESIYTSSYIGLADRTLQKMKAENRTLDSFAGQVSLDSVFGQSTNFNYDGKFISAFANEGARIQFARDMLSSVMKELHSDLEEKELTLALSKMIALSKVGANCSPEIKTGFENHLADLYHQASSEQAKFVLGNTISTYVNDNPDRASAFSQTDALSAYPSDTQSRTISEDKLFLNGTCAVRVCFYSDKLSDSDGERSFEGFLATMKAQKKWKVEDKGLFVTISRSVGARKMVILANKPDAVGIGDAEIDSYMNANDLTQTILIHRGHSTHSEGSEIKMTSETALYMDLGCGAYKRLLSMIDRAPDCQFIGTKGIATSNVNNPLTSKIFDAIVEQGRINLGKKFKVFMNSISDQRGRDYTTTVLDSVLKLRQKTYALFAGKIGQDLTESEPEPVTPSAPQTAVPAHPSAG